MSDVQALVISDWFCKCGHIRWCHQIKIWT